MQIGLVMDGLAEMDFLAGLDWAVARGIEAVEIGTGGFSHAPHCQLQELVASQQARDAFMEAITGETLR